MSTKRDKPSTKARRDGYAKLNKLGGFLFKLLYPYHDRFADGSENHWLEMELDKLGWRDFMIRYIPALKRGGPDVLRSNRSKRRKQKNADRQTTIR